MNILILGTSNSLIKQGWVAGLRVSLPSAQIKNLSIGASPGIQFGAHMNMNFRAYDIVFFDSTPNDEQYDWRIPGYSTLGYISEIIDRIFGLIASQTRLIVLGFCLKRYLTKESNVFLMHRDLCLKNGGEFVNVRHIINHLGPAIMGKDGDLYEEHPAHPSNRISFEIGRALGLFIAGAKPSKTRNTHAPPKSSTEFPKDQFETGFFSTNLANFSNVTDSRTFTNSLLSETFAILRQHESIEIPNFGLCIGFYINTASTSCDVILLTKDMGREILLKLYHNLWEGGLQKIFVPIPNGIELGRISIDFQASRAGFCPLIAQSTHRKDDEVKAAISYLVFYNPSHLSISEVSQGCDISDAIMELLRNLAPILPPQEAKCPR